MGARSSGQRSGWGHGWVSDDNRCSCSVVRTLLADLPCPFRQPSCPGAMSPTHAHGYLAGLELLPASPSDPKLWAVPCSPLEAQLPAGPFSPSMCGSELPPDLGAPQLLSASAQLPQTTETYFLHFWRPENPKSRSAVFCVCREPLPGSQTATFPQCPCLAGE